MPSPVRSAATTGIAAIGILALAGCVSSTTVERTEDNSIVQTETDAPNVLELER